MHHRRISLSGSGITLAGGVRMIKILSDEDFKSPASEKIKLLAKLEYEANYHQKLSTEQIMNWNDDEYGRYVAISNLAECCYFHR